MLLRLLYYFIIILLLKIVLHFSYTVKNICIWTIKSIFCIYPGHKNFRRSKNCDVALSSI